MTELHWPARHRVRSAATAAAALAWLVTTTASVAALQSAQDPEASQGNSGQDNIEQLISIVPFESSRNVGDTVELTASGGLYYSLRDLEVRAENAFIVLDRQELETATAKPRRVASDGLPRRGLTRPGAGRSLDQAAIRRRAESLLAATGPRRPGGTEIPENLPFELMRSVYLEGRVRIVQAGTEILTADRVFISIVDDRAVFEGVKLRLTSVDSSGRELQVVVRGPRLVRQQGRFTGRDISVTTCTAGEPHVEIVSGEVEIIERRREFEVRTRDNRLAFSGVNVLPLPDASYFTSDQDPLLLKGASASYSGRQGIELGIELGSSWNDLGGAAHRFLTGRPSDEFRGNWRLGLGVIEERGAPFDLDVDYRAGDLYFGRTRAFYLHDNGTNIREIRRYLDGSPIDRTDRHLVHSENRLQFDERTRLDLSVFQAGDPAVFSEFFSGDYYGSELPETSAQLRHADRNYIGTVTGRFQLNDFNYSDGRALTERYVEQLPVATFDLFSERLMTLPGDAPLLLTSSTSVGAVRSDYDATLPPIADDQTLRFDSELELAAPYRFGPFGVRGYGTARFTHFDETALSAESDNRVAFASGVSIGTRLARSWRWQDPDGQPRALRHVMSPTLDFQHVFRVEGEPSDFRQFDRIDSLDEGANVRVGMLQRLQASWVDQEGIKDISEFVWLDVAQNLKPISERDNNGHHLGLLEFEAIVRPTPGWAGLNGLVFLTEGEHDWNRDELRTFNNSVQFRTNQITWQAEYRADQTQRGQLGYGARLPIRRRWNLEGYGRYDLETSDSISYRARLTRRDHDWRIAFSVNYNNVTDDTSFNLEFEPSLGGLFRPRNRRFVGAADYGVRDFGAY